MKRRTPRKLKKGFRSLLKRRDTKWKRKAKNIVCKAVDIMLHYCISKPVSFEPGGIVYESDKPESRSGEYVMTKDQAQQIEELLERKPKTEPCQLKLSQGFLIKDLANTSKVNPC